MVRDRNISTSAIFLPLNPTLNILESEGKLCSKIPEFKITEFIRIDLLENN
jgi:hypothetical protein